MRHATKQTIADIDIDAAQEFLNWLDAKKQHTFQTFADNAERGDGRLVDVLHGSFAEHKERLAELNGRGAGAFVKMNRTDGKGGTEENITGIRAVSGDLDGSPLDPVRECKLKPHMIVESSAGRYHVYWCVKKNFPLDQFKGVQRSIAKRFDGDPDIAKLTHCARLPGFFHNKGEPFLTRLIETNDVDDYSAEEILAEFPPEAEAHRPSISRKGAIVLPAGRPVEQARIFLQHRFSHEGAICLHFYRGGFYEWDSSSYKEREEKYIRSELYGFLDKAVVPSDKGAMVPFNPTRAKVGEILDALESGVFQIRDHEAPFWLTSEFAHIPTAELIACKNGLLDLSDRTLIPHTPYFFNVNALPFDYDPDAPEPERWRKFQRELWPDDKQARLCLQEIFGYMLTADTSQQKLFLLVGPKRSGKGTIARVLTGLLGKANVAGPTLASLGTDFGLWPLIDKRVAIISDARMGSTDAHAVAEHLLAISGEDLRTVNRKYQTAWSGRLGVRFLICTNELPRITDASGALASRFVPLTLRESFYDKEDLQLTDKLLSELPGILNWSLDGLDRLRKRGYFVLPESSLEAMRMLEDLASPMRAFVREWCRIGPDEWIAIDELFKAREAWADDSGMRRTNKIALGRDLRAAFPKVTRAMKGREKVYIGIGLSKKGRSQYEEVCEAARGKRSRRGREPGEEG